MPASQRVVQICLLLLAAIGMFGGALQMVLGQPGTTPRLDNVHRFMAGIYFGSALIALWTGLTVRRQGTLVFLIAIGVFLGAVGRLISMSVVGLPDPPAVWLGYLLPELVVPWIIIVAHTLARRHSVTA